MRKHLSLLQTSSHIVFQASPTLSAVFFLVLTLQSLVPTLTVWSVKRLVDEAILWNAAELIRWGAVWLGVLFADQVLGPIAAAIQGNLNERLTAHLNLLLMKKVNEFEDLTPFEDETFYDRVRLLREQASYQPTNLIIFLTAVLRETLTLLPLLIVVGSLGWWIPLALLLAATPYALVSFKLQRAVWETVTGTNPEARRMEYASTLLLDPRYAKEHRLYRSAGFWIAFYRKHFQKLHKAMRAQRNRQLVGNLAYVGVSVLGVSLAVFGLFTKRPSPGDLAMFLSTLGYLQQNLLLLVQDAGMLFESLLYMDELHTFLAEKPTLKAGPGLRVSEAHPPEIVFESVGFAYPDGRKALDGIQLRIEPGQRIGLVGENGAGKTTLVKLLLRFYDPTEGRILVNGRDLRELDIKAWRASIAAVFQDFGTYALSLSENVGIAEPKRMYEEKAVFKALAEAEGEELVAKLPDGLKTMLTKAFGGTELSGGEWQKVVLARAFFRKNAKLMILDEPSAALDPLSELAVYKRFAELARGRTAVLISHRLASVRTADRIVVLKGGRIAETGTHDELLRKSGEYAAMWQAQSDWYR